MNKILIIILLLTSSIAIWGQNKSVTIYNNGLTHDNVSADIFNNDTTYTYSVTTAAMWTGKLSTKIVYKGQYNAFINFMIQLFQFAEANKNNKGAKAVINDINVESTKKAGVKCISIGNGKDVSNTTYKSIKGALEAITSWKESN
ncbi:hypothetical protein BcellWH2_05536 [Bacteroides cellulosilyticus]|jgi:hypothetical protein|uniref:Uncharacterized protein n=1 Tax=Bacteroides cellulosilyticus TaxID=246787 RepID=A0A0P0GN78_9BACE|nr:hypothetical protein [Bacteroides cellulosilyticus]ALJ62734.1 hypothetical protein BcellWH2_05536 [Bacteroides cellulosilyticus]DAH41301.1 MAG TPA: hypothetical protein [Caudoviricetes sp.]